MEHSPAPIASIDRSESLAFFAPQISNIHLLNFDASFSTARHSRRGVSLFSFIPPYSSSEYQLYQCAASLVKLGIESWQLKVCVVRVIFVPAPATQLDAINGHTELEQKFQNHPQLNNFPTKKLNVPFLAISASAVNKSVNLHKHLLLITRVNRAGQHFPTA